MPTEHPKAFLMCAVVLWGLAYVAGPLALLGWAVGFVTAVLLFAVTRA